MAQDIEDTKWEYLVVIINRQSNRVRYVNNREVPDWKRGPLPVEYFNQLGEKGWEMTISFVVETDAPNVWFKRKKK